MDSNCEFLSIVEFSFCSVAYIFLCGTYRDMYNEWTIELKAMADRIISMRHELFDALRAKGQHFFEFYSCSHPLMASDISFAFLLFFLLVLLG